MEKKMIYPSKYRIYWDARIPMEYYEEEFIEFEDYLLLTDQRVHSTSDNPHAKSDYFLDRFAKYEKWQKAEDRKEQRKLLRAQNKRKAKNTTEVSNVKLSEGSMLHNSEESAKPSLQVTFISLPKRNGSQYYSCQASLSFCVQGWLPLFLSVGVHCRQTLT